MAHSLKKRDTTEVSEKSVRAKLQGARSLTSSLMEESVTDVVNTNIPVDFLERRNTGDKVRENLMIYLM
jgi:hypothetical protein